MARKPSGNSRRSANRSPAACAVQQPTQDIAGNCCVFWAKIASRVIAMQEQPPYYPRLYIGNDESSRGPDVNYLTVPHFLRARSRCRANLALLCARPLFSVPQAFLDRLVRFYQEQACVASSMRRSSMRRSSMRRIGSICQCMAGAATVGNQCRTSPSSIIGRVRW